jgi:hypothetical protein
MLPHQGENMKRCIPAIALMAFVFGGLGSAWAGGGGGADRLRDPNGRGTGMSTKAYNEAVKRRSKKTTAPGQMQTQH